MSLPNDAISAIGARAPEHGASALVVDIFERSGALFLCLDERGRIVRANPAIAERLGYANDELLSLSLADLMPSERCDDARALLERLRAGNTMVSAEATFMTRAGDHVYVRGMLSPRIQDGRLTTAFGVFNEHVVGAPLRSTLGVDPNLLDAMLDASPDGISLFDANETIVAYNRRCLEVWEIEESDVKDGNVRAAMLRRLADPDAFLETVNRLYARRGASGSGQFRLLSGRVLDWHSACAYDPDGSYRGRIWYYRDVTDRVQAEDLYRRLANNFPDGAVLIYDTEL